MIQVPKQVLTNLCEKLSIQEEKLVFLGGGREDSDGIVYTFEKNNKKMVLKILAFPVKDIGNLDKLKLRVQYANYLGEHGIQLAYPILNENHNLYETEIWQENIFTAYVMEFADGVSPKSEEIDHNLLIRWGKLTGKSHQISKKFMKTIPMVSFGYQDELDFFYHWCKNPVVKEAWTQMKEVLATLPVTDQDYSFIHNDNHQFNILVLKDKLTLIDFDCSSPQFLIHDITTPAQGIMFDLTGGMMSPVSDQDRIKRFFDSFLTGYEQECHLSDFWYSKLNTFINYRRMLLFTCMEDWINTQPELKSGFIQMIQNPPTIL